MENKQWVMVPVELKELLASMVKLHESRGTVLTVQMHQLEEMLAAAPQPAEQQAAPDVAGWISVDDRLPEDGQVIVALRPDNTPWAGEFSPLGGQLRCLDRHTGKWWGFRYWAPLPDAPAAHQKREGEI